MPISLGALNGAGLAMLLLSGAARHAGARWLAALVASIALRMVPYVLGFAGAYDRWRWLTFAPFDLTLAWGPLLWMYVQLLATSRPPDRWRWHFVPAAVQLAYQLVCFALPEPSKWEWYTTVHLAVVEPAGLFLGLVSIVAYVVAALRAYRSWQHWLDANISNRDESRLVWLGVILSAMAGVAALALLYAGWHWAVAPTTYAQRAPLVVALALLAYVLGLLGWRFGPAAIPIRLPPAEAVPEPANAFAAASSLSSAALPASDVVGPYVEQALRWQAKVVREGWHRDPLLSLAVLAARLETSPRTLSRVLNEGMQVTFNDFINGQRAREAVERLRAEPSTDVLRIAYDVGFASKASFNRAFKRHTGMTPSEVRHGSSDGSHNPPIPAMAEGEAR